MRKGSHRYGPGYAEGMRAAMRSRIIGVLCSAALLTGLAGCSLLAGGAEDPEPEPTPTSTREAAPSPAPESTVEPTPEENAPVVIPGCEGILTDAQVAAFAPTYVAIADPDATRLYEVHRHTLGPVALQSLDSALQVRHCSWGLPNSDDLVHVIVAELPGDVRDSFIAELRNSVYVESQSDDVAVFVDPNGTPHVGRNWYGFKGPIWVAMVPNHDDVGAQIFENLEAANPGLATY